MWMQILWAHVGCKYYGQMWDENISDHVLAQQRSLGVFAAGSSKGSGFLGSSVSSSINLAFIFLARCPKTASTFWPFLAEHSIQSTPQHLANSTASSQDTSLPSTRSILFPMIITWAELAPTCVRSSIHPLIFWKLSRELTEKTTSTPQLLRQQVCVMVLYFSCPAVSQICSLIRAPSTANTLKTQFMPMVIMQLSTNTPSVYRSRTLLLPTPESPIMIIFCTQSKGSSTFRLPFKPPRIVLQNTTVQYQAKSYPLWGREKRMVKGYDHGCAFLQRASMALERETLSSLLRKFLVANYISREMASILGWKEFLAGAKYYSIAFFSFTTAFSQAQQLPSLAFLASFSSLIPTQIEATASMGRRCLRVSRSSSIIQSKRQTATKPEMSCLAARLRGNLRISLRSGGSAYVRVVLSQSLTLKVAATALSCNCRLIRAWSTACLGRGLFGYSSDTLCRQAAQRRVLTARQRLLLPYTCFKYCSNRPSFTISANLPPADLEMKSLSRERKTYWIVGSILAILKLQRAGLLLRVTISERIRCVKKDFRSMSIVLGFTKGFSLPITVLTQFAISPVSSSSLSRSNSSPY